MSPKRRHRGGKSRASSGRHPHPHTVEELQEQAFVCTQNAHYEDAEKLFRMAIDMDPRNGDLLDALGQVILELGRPQDALEVFQRSAEVDPEGSFVKYLNLGQLSEGMDSITFYNKGCEILQRRIDTIARDLNSSSFQGNAEERLEELRDQLASSLAAIAEVYMTDCCYEENAEQECERALQVALEAAPSNVEVHQTMASMRLSQCREEDAADLLKKALELMEPLDDTKKPAIPFRLATAKLLMEVKHYEEACHLLDSLVEEDDQIGETWYLRGLAYSLCGQEDKCVEFLAIAYEIMHDCEEDADLCEDIREKYPQSVEMAERAIEEARRQQQEEEENGEASRC